MRLLEEVDLEVELAQLVDATAVVPASCGHPLQVGDASTRSTSVIGSWRNRRPISRKASGSPVVRKRYVPSRAGSCSIPLRASVSATSRAVSSAEKTSVTSRPKTRWKIGRRSG